MTQEFLPLSKLIGGINAFEAECTGDQCVEALDVWEREGSLKRRPAFKSIACGPVFVLPRGATTVVHEFPFSTFETITDGNPLIDAAEIGGNAGRLWIGASIPFDGVDVRHISGVVNIANNTNKRIAVKYRNTSLALVQAFDTVDTTKRKTSLSNSSLDAFGPFLQDGRISWHKSQFTAWTATSLNSITRYWVALDWSVAEENPDVAAVGSVPSNISIVATVSPGLRVFLTEPINGLHSAKLRNATKTIMVGADRRLRHGKEKGGNHGTIRNIQQETEITRIVEREGSGVMGVVTQPNWSAGGSGTNADGTSGTLTKFDRTYSLFVPSELTGNVQVPVVTSTGVPTTTRINVMMPTAHAGINFEGCWLLGLTGAHAGTIVEIFNSTATYIEFFPALGSMVIGDTFSIITPPASIRTNEGSRNYAILSNTAHTVTYFPSASGFTSALATADTNRYVNFEASREAPWALVAGHQYVYTFNPVTGNILFTNSENRILEFDGLRTRRLKALFDSTDGVDGADKVQEWTGNLPDLATELNDPSINLGSALRRQPPDAKLITTFASRIVCTLRDDPTKVQWTAPGAFNDIWPEIYSTSVRDAFSQPITALIPLHDQLLAATPTSLHVADAPGENGFLNFYPIAQGVGFLNHNSIGRLAAGAQVALIGPNADGISLWNGSAATTILDSWFRVIPEGVNARLLTNAVGAIWQQEQLYFCAVPSAGSSVNNRVVVVDYSTNKFWLWSCPFGGISAMTREYDDAGVERILFGTNDGHICVLDNRKYDGVAAITGYAKSPIISFNGQTYAFTNIKLQEEELGTGTLQLKTFINCGSSSQTQSKTFSSGGDVYGTDLFGTATWQDPKVKSVMFNLKAGNYDGTSFTTGTVGESIQYQIQCTTPFKFRGATLLATKKGMRLK